MSKSGQNFKPWVLWLCGALVVVCTGVVLAVVMLNPSFTKTERILAQGLPSETPMYTLNSGKEGKTILFLAGTHGNEEAGYMAAERMLDTLKPLQGRIIIIPYANKRAIEAYTRTSPEGVDMNRSYPGDAQGNDIEQLCAQILSVIEQEKPVAVIDMHEGRNFYGVDGSIGNSIVAGLKAESYLLLPDILDYVNSRNDGLPDFTFDANAPQGSLNCEAHKLLGVDTYTIETTQKLDLEIRIRQQHTFVQGLMTLYEIPFEMN